MCRDGLAYGPDTIPWLATSSPWLLLPALRLLPRGCSGTLNSSFEGVASFLVPSGTPDGCSWRGGLARPRRARPRFPYHYS